MRSMGVRFLVLAMLFSFGAKSVLAHASLSRSEPPANTSLDAAPAEIRLWFTEPLEPNFSRITLRNERGEVIQTSASPIAGANASELATVPGDVPDGLYTVSWRVLSTDGHPTEGSFSFGVGVTVTDTASVPAPDDIIPADSAVIRGLNLLSLAVAVGSIAFWLFVWSPAVPEGQPQVECRIRQVMWFGWFMLGVTTILMLLLQVSIAVEVSVLDAVIHPALRELLVNGRYGSIWLTRVILWAGLGEVLRLARTQRWLYWLALLLGGQILLTMSLYSHASAVQQDTTAAIVAAWLHLTTTALWLGGLIPFFLIIGLVRQHFAGSQILSQLVGYFSNFARVNVAGVLVSGAYAAWIHAGSMDALLTTTYGQTLVVKQLLVLPLLLIAATNLFLTRHSLQKSQTLWAGRLRGLIGAEIALAVGVLLAGGVMTAIAPARTVAAVRDARPPAVQPYMQMETADTLMAHLDITPGLAGENTFRVTLYDLNGLPVTDATLMRLRFEALTQNLGQSELRPELQPDGSYSISGANLSLSGQWRIRMTVQRPGEFDTVLDFSPTISSPQPPVVDTTIPVWSQWLILTLTGMILLSVGGYFAAQYAARPFSGAAVVSFLMLGAGIIFLFSAVMAMGSLPRNPSAYPNETVYSGTRYEPPVSLEDFTLPASTGGQLSLSHFRGRPVLLFFGFTHCPDICPLTMSEFRRVKTLLGDAGQQAAFVFVSVDPARDTPAVIAEYLAKYDADFVGMSGDEATLARIGPQYSLDYELPADADPAVDYRVTHTGGSYLIDAAGQLRVFYAYGTSADIMADGLRQVMQGNS